MSSTRLELALPSQLDPAVRAKLARTFADPSAAAVRYLALTPAVPNSDEDFRSALDAVAEYPPPALDYLFVGGARVVTFDGISRVFARPGRLGSANRIAHFGGEFPRIRMLDLRDEVVEWHASLWPELETLVLRPRHAERGVAWARTVLASAAPFPLLREVRFPENDGDALLAALLDSPLLPQLRCVDLTDNITNTGAQLLLDHADRVAHLAELWIGSSGQRRLAIERMTRPSAPEYPRGTFEIDNALASRLRARLGRVLRFNRRPGYPDL